MQSIFGSLADLTRGVSSFISSYSNSQTAEPFTDATPAQVNQVRKILMNTPKNGLPVELADMILDLAEYWACIRTTVEADLRVSAGWGHVPMTFLYIETPPLGLPIGDNGVLIGKPRKVEFKTLSRDQGWADNKHLYGGYLGSFSWFEASIFRRVDPSREEETKSSPLEVLLASLTRAQDTPLHVFGTPQTQDESVRFYGEQCEIVDLEQRLSEHNWEFVRKPTPLADVVDARDETRNEHGVSWLVQRNVVAGNQVKEHVVEWTINTDEEPEVDHPVDGKGNGLNFVECLKRGDVIGVWARALYGGWANQVAEVEIAVYYFF